MGLMINICYHDYCPPKVQKRELLPLVFCVANNFQFGCIFFVGYISYARLALVAVIFL